MTGVAARILPYPAALDLLRRHAIPVAPASLVADAAQAAAAANALGYPVVVKAISSRFTHKADSGLLALDLVDERQVERAAAELASRIPPADLDGILVQKMVSGGIEVIVGVQRDPQFGPAVILGAGGTLVELLDDTVLRLAPVTHRQAGQMVEETRLYRLLKGFRGRPPADIQALVELLVQVSRLALAEQARLVSLDLNPVMVLGQGRGAVVVDFRCQVEGD